jgi:hypothetical protein
MIIPLSFPLDGLSSSAAFTSSSSIDL